MIRQFLVCSWCILILVGCQSNASYTRVLKYSLDEQFLLSNFEYLASDALLGRKAGTPASELAQQHIISQLQQHDVKPFGGQYKHPFVLSRSSKQTVLGNNIVGEILSPAATGYIVLTAHFDHLGKKGSHIFNGADDNASGTAATLTLVKKLSEIRTTLKHNILVVFTDGEESNLKGIRAFVKKNNQLMASIKLNINLDMLAGSKHSNRLHFFERRLDKLLSPEQEAQFIQHQQYSDFSVLKGFKRRLISENQRVAWLKASDHYAFYRQGIPFIYYGVGVHPNYHTPNDTYENSNTRLLVQAANAVYHQLLLLDQMI